MADDTGTVTTDSTGTDPATGDDASLGDGGKSALKAERARASAAEKAANAALAELETLRNANKSEEDKRLDRLTKAEQAASEATVKALRYEVAADTGLPLNLAGRLQGSTREELAADAAALLELVGSTSSGDENPPPAGTKPAPVLRNGGNPTPDALNGDPLLDSLVAKLGAPRR